MYWDIRHIHSKKSDKPDLQSAMCPKSVGVGGMLFVVVNGATAMQSLSKIWGLSAEYIQHF